jgi:hypothetical protein
VTVRGECEIVLLLSLRSLYCQVNIFWKFPPYYGLNT